MLASPARSRSTANPLTPPAVLLSGGETTVTIGSKATGRGGRNTTFLLGLALALDGRAGIWGIAGDTDGIDGMDDVAGAILGARYAGASPGARVSTRAACSPPMTVTGSSMLSATRSASAPR